MDAAAERAILERFRGKGARIVSEEVGVEGDGDVTVVVDPIDGSLNAKRGIPFFAISIAVADGRTMDDVHTAYVYDFGTREEWTAVKGHGALLNGAALLERPKDELEILSFEATTTAFVAENAARFVGVAHRLRVMGSLAVTPLPPRRRTARRSRLAEGGAVGRHRGRPAPRAGTRARDRPARGAAVRCCAARSGSALARRRGRK